MELVSIIGYTGGIILSFQSLPQVFKVWSTKSAKDLSYASLLTYLMGGSLTVTYGVLINQPPIYAPLVFSMINICNLLLSKFYFESRYPLATTKGDTVSTNGAGGTSGANDNNI